jgi:hypothetical protein
MTKGRLHFPQPSNVVLKWEVLGTAGMSRVKVGQSGSENGCHLTLTPKGLRGVFSKKHSKTAVSSSRSPTDFFSIF